jgi:hypothetical protein
MFDFQWTNHSSLIISTNIVPLKPFQNIINLPCVVENLTPIKIFPSLFNELFTFPSFTLVVPSLNLHIHSLPSQSLISPIPIHAFASFFNSHQHNND